MKVFAYAALGFCGLMGSVVAAPQGLEMESINKAELSEKSGKAISPTFIKAQVLLDRARFSPGVIDGRGGENTEKALKAFGEARGLKPGGKLDEAIWAKLNEDSSEPVLIEYTIRDEDVKGPFEKIPEKMEEQAELERLAYSSPEELIAEKFHMDEDLLKALNPDADFSKAGASIVVANVRDKEEKAGESEKVAKIEVDKSEGILRALDKDGSMIVFYPATVGSKEKPAPSGTHQVEAIAENPTYTYNPDYNFSGVKTDKKFEIKAGPNNPVGTVWIDLSVESYGIHGTPDPATVGKTASHGCVRLTNWDVEQLSKMVAKGTPVTFLD
jgi:lipoprotein-anchoring transpeptidase ErfK/SrfK